MATLQTVYAKTSVGGYIFDAYLSLTHESTLEITTHPVETGAALTDNSYLDPVKVTMTIGQSDVCTDVIAGQFGVGDGRSVTAFNILKILQSNRIPLQVTTRLATYQNMLVQSITAQDTNKTAHGLSATVVLQEVLVAVVKTVQISSRPQVTDSTPKGAVQSTGPSQTMLKHVASAFGLPSY